MEQRDKTGSKRRGGLTYCGELLRSGDRDRYLVTLFAPDGVRADLWALFAFNLEIARTREVVTNQTLGLIRLQWWREAVEAIYAGKPSSGGETLLELSRIIHAHNLPAELFEALIAAREGDLDFQSFESFSSLISYIDVTNVPLMLLAALIDGGREAEANVRNIARAYAIAGILRAMPYERLRIAGMLAVDPSSGAALREKASFLAREADLMIQEKPVTGLFRAAREVARIGLRQAASADYELLDDRFARPVAFRELRLWWGVHTS